MKRETIKQQPLLRIKAGVPSLSREEMIGQLNYYGPIEMANVYCVSKVTLFKAIHYYGIKRLSRYE